MDGIHVKLYTWQTQRQIRQGNPVLLLRIQSPVLIGSWRRVNIAAIPHVYITSHEDQTRCLAPKQANTQHKALVLVAWHVLLSVVPSSSCLQVLLRSRAGITYDRAVSLAIMGRSPLHPPPTGAAGGNQTAVRPWVPSLPPRTQQQDFIESLFTCLNKYQCRSRAALDGRATLLLQSSASGRGPRQSQGRVCGMGARWPLHIKTLSRGLRAA